MPRDRLRAIERVLGRKIGVLPLDRSGINFEREQPQQRAQHAPRTQQSYHPRQQRANRPQGGQRRWSGGRG